VLYCFRTQKERRTFKAGIRSELVENVAMLIADSLLNVHGRIKLPGVRQKGQVNDKTMIIGKENFLLNRCEEGVRRRTQ